MKVWCMYNVWDKETDQSLAVGYKQKDFDIVKPLIIKGYTYRCFPLFWRKRTDYFRTATVNGRECYIMYWALSWKVKPCNMVTVLGKKFGLSGRYYETVKL